MDLLGIKHNGESTVGDLASIEIGEEIVRVKAGGEGKLEKPPATKADTNGQRVSTDRAATGSDAACAVIEDVVPALSVILPKSELDGIVSAATSVAKAVKTRSTKGDKRRGAKLPGFGKVIELCGPNESNLKVAAREFDKANVFTVTKELRHHYRCHHL